MFTKKALPSRIFRHLSVAIIALVFLMAMPANAQNTKGDKPTSTSAPSAQKKKLFGKKQSGARVSSGSKGIKRSDRVSNKPLPGAPVNTSPPSGRSRAYTKTISGGRITAPRSSTGSVKRVYSQRGPYVNNPSPTPEKSASRHKWPKGKTATGQSTTPRSATAKYHKKVYPQRGPFINNPSPTPKRPDAKPRNQPLYQARNLSMSKAAAQARSMGIKGAGFKTITARFVTKRKNDVYWGKVRKKADQAFQGDITGRKLRTLDQRSPKIGLVGTDTLPFARRSPRQMKRKPSQALGGYQTATRTGRAWKGDIAGGKIRRNPNSGTSEKSGKFVWPRKLSISAKGKGTGDFIHPRPKVATRPSPKVGSKPVPGKPPGIGAVAFMGFSKRSSALKKPKGFGGSVTAKMKKDNRPLPSNGVSGSSMRISRFSGNIKSGRPAHGGGSVSGRLWNNDRNPVTVKKAGAGTIGAAQFRGRQRFGSGREFSQIGLGFTGMKKGLSRPVKGGGSVSGRLWNNDRNPVTVKKAGAGTISAAQFRGRQRFGSGREFSQIGLGFTGMKKGLSKPIKGGGSVSGKIWNNKNNPVEVHTGGKGTRLAGMYQGNIKTKRPEKGGGSVSGQIWNNKNNPIEVHTGGRGTRLAGMYQGNIKTKRPEKGGGSVSGKTWNNKNNPIEVHVGGKGTQMAGNYSGRIKTSNRGKINNKKTSLLAKLQNKGNLALPATHIKRDEQAANFKHRGKKVVIPGAEVTQIGLNYTGDRKRAHYTKAPNSPKEALKVREPGKAQPHIGELQVNVKMKKHFGNELHPDARFANSYRDNVKEERTFLMNVRLTWAKIFKKSDNQPRNLKEKPSKPRYDPAEIGLWYK